MEKHIAVREVGEELIRTVSPEFRNRAENIVENYYKEGILREKHKDIVKIIKKAKKHGMEKQALDFIESVFQYHKNIVNAPKIAGEKAKKSAESIISSPEWLKDEITRRTEEEITNWSIPYLIRKMAETMDAVDHPDAERALLHFMGSVANGTFSTVEKEKILMHIARNMEALINNQNIPREKKIEAIKALGTVAQVLDRLPDREQMKKALWRDVADKEKRGLDETRRIPFFHFVNRMLMDPEKYTPAEVIGMVKEVVPPELRKNIATRSRRRKRGRSLWNIR